MTDQSHAADRRTVAQIRAGGSAWLTEQELRWLCDVADEADVLLKSLPNTTVHGGRLAALIGARHG